MTTITTLIVDDEPLARKGIKRLLDLDPDIQVVGECGDGMDAIEGIRTKKPDLMFLDIQMPEKNGFEVLESLDAPEIPIVIFVTAYDQHALKAFEVHALDYLLKPFDDERFNEALVRAKKELAKREEIGINDRLIDLLNERMLSHPRLDRVMIKAGGRISFLRAEEIDWIEAEGDYVCLHTQGKKHLLRERISELEQRLEPEKFVRIHRSTIVNIDRIKEMQPLFYGEYAVILHDGTRLTLSRSFRGKVFQHLTIAS